MMRTGQWKDYKYMLYKTDIVTQTITEMQTHQVTSTRIHRVWSQDGKTVAIGSDIDDRDFDIWLVDPNGGGYLQNLARCKH